ncbi:MAG: DUF3426 domain-containing protein [Gammaproteobacteria bacterium]|nr:DUF3426 domain-containing protein [Gammaproteobacteria bacterium]
MHTCCPQCKTCFRISNEQMNVAQGLVRCGQCQQIFNARKNLMPETALASPARNRAKDKLTPTAPSTDTTPANIASETPTTKLMLDPSVPLDKLRQTRFDHFDIGHYQRKPPLTETEAPIQVSTDINITEDELTDALNILSEQPSANLSKPAATIENTPVPKSDEITIFDDIPERAETQNYPGINFDIVSEEPNISTDWYTPPTSDHTHIQFEEINDTSISGLADTAKPQPDTTGQKLSTSDHDYNYAYANIDDDLEVEKNIDDIYSDMQQQLSEPAENTTQTRFTEDEIPDNKLIDDEAIEITPPARQRQPIKRSDEDELNQAIDSIFFDSSIDFGEALPNEEDAHRIEKEVLASLDKAAEYHTHISPVIYEEEEEIVIGQHRSDSLTDHDIPLRLRDSLKAHPPQKTSLGKKLLGTLAFLLLTILLLGQVALFRNTDIIVLFPAAQPWMEIYCGYLPCRIQTQRDISKIRILERDIRAHSSQKNALLITATIVNKADFNQPYPDIMVLLSDLTGATVAQRRFTPADYMGELNSPFLLMKAGTPVYISITVIDPGKDAVNFEFSFL